MTNTPETPAPASTPPATESAASAAVAAPPDAAPAAAASELDGVLDRGTYDRLLTGRSPQRLDIPAGVWHQISRQYLRVQLITSGAILLVDVVVGLVAGLVWALPWIFIPTGILAVILVWTMAILPRQVRAIGYRLRTDDLLFRRGILWQRMVAVPYGRMQLVDITHGPLDRGFGIAQLKLVTAAATTGITIPGLEQAAAEALRDHLVSVAETRRTGL